MTGGANKVIISAPSADALMFVMGVYQRSSKSLIWILSGTMLCMGVLISH